MHVDLAPIDYPVMRLTRRDPDPDFVNWFYILVGGEEDDATMPVAVTCNGVVEPGRRFSSPRAGGTEYYTPLFNYIGEAWQLVASPMLEHQSWSFNFQPVFES